MTKNSKLEQELAVARLAHNRTWQAWYQARKDQKIAETRMRRNEAGLQQTQGARNRVWGCKTSSEAMRSSAMNNYERAYTAFVTQRSMLEAAQTALYKATENYRQADYLYRGVLKALADEKLVKTLGDREL